MAASTTHLLHHLIFKPSPPSLLLIKPLCISTSFHLQKPIRTIVTNKNPSQHHSSPHLPLPHRLRFFVKFSATPTYSEVPSPNLSLEENPKSDFVPEDEFEEEEEVDEFEEEGEEDEFEEEVNEEEEEEEEDEEEEEEEEELNEPGNEEQEAQTPVKASSSSSSKSAANLPTLSVKERKELVSYAHSLGKKLKIQQVGKSGVTSSLASAFVDNLECNELLKIKVQNNCPEELPDVVKQLEEKTGSVAVSQIGRTVILYRPSLTKLKEGEKKKQAQRTGWRKPFTPKPTEGKRVQVMRLSGRGRRGASRMSS